MTRQELWAGLRRLLILVVGAAGVTAVVSAGLGLVFGMPIQRAITVGLYLMGCVCLLLGFLYGNRAPVRGTDGRIPGMFGGVLTAGSDAVRWASPDERGEEFATSAIFVTLGFALIVFGALLDGQHGLG